MTHWLIPLAAFLGALIGAPLGWLAREFWLAKRKKQEIRAWHRARKFFSSSNNKNW